MAEVKTEGQPSTPSKQGGSKGNAKNRHKDAGGGGSSKRKCVSTACIACRRRKSKCDGNLPSCAACASVYGTECVYDPNSDHRRKGVYKKGVDSSKTPDSTLKTIIEGILNYPEHEVFQLVREIRSCENLDDVAQSILSHNAQQENGGAEDALVTVTDASDEQPPPRFEKELSGQVGELKLENGAKQFLGGTSNLLYVDNDAEGGDLSENEDNRYASQEDAIRSWTMVTSDTNLILHLLYMYFTWHYTYFTTLSRSLFFRDFLKGKPEHVSKSKTVYCTPLLLNAMLTLGCHFTSWPAARANPDDSNTAGDHFMKECKRILVEDEDYEVARIATVQALALMSVREAGCAREAKGWFYSGMSFRMACDMGLPYESSSSSLPPEEVDARRMTFWGCYLFDKCWSNYLGRAPQLPLENITLKKFDVFPTEDADTWTPWTDNGLGTVNAQPARTRAVALQILALCEISSDLLYNFYRPHQVEQPLSKQAELNKLSDLHTRLEAWRKELPKEFEAKEGQLPQIFVMHMFFYLLFIHLFRPFLKYSQGNSPLPAHVSPRKHCIQSAAAISKLLRLYKKTHGLKQICNIAVYITHSACTIHLLNIQDKDSRRDLVYGLRHLEEICESWPCARRTMGIIAHQIEKWQIELPSEAFEVIERADAKFQLTRHKHSSRSNTGSPAGELQGSHDHFSTDNPLSPTSMGRFDFSQPMDPTSPHTIGQPPISQTARVRSNSSARRSELLRQMQQNSLFQNQINNPIAFTGTPEQRTKWGDSAWRGDLSVNTALAHDIPTTGGAQYQQRVQQPLPLPPRQQLASQVSPKPASNGSPDLGTVASPTALFSGQQQQKILLDEQREWWMRDQSTLFDHWMQRESISRNSNGTPGPPGPPVPPANSTHQGANLMGMDVYAGLADPVASMTTGAGFDTVSVATMPPSWDGFNIQGDNSAQQGNGGNFGGYNTRIL